MITPLADKAILEAPAYVPFEIRYPLQILMPSVRIGLEDLRDRASVFARLRRNMFFTCAPADRQACMIQNVSRAEGVVEFALAHLAEEHPELTVESVSLFGSYLYSDERAPPGDIDLLVLVQGNHYSLEEIGTRGCPFATNTRPGLRHVGLSIKGLDNFQNGCADQGAGASAAVQMPVIHRTATALSIRHFPLVGCAFHDNHSVWRKNALAQASDLLRNCYNRFYKVNPARPMACHDRAKKILSRVYEAMVHMHSAYPDAGIEPEQIYELKVQTQDGQAGFAEAEGALAMASTCLERLAADDRVEVRVTAEPTPAAPPDLFSAEDRRHCQDLVRTARAWTQDGTLGKFLPVLARIVDGTGETVITAGRRVLDTPTRYGMRATHAEIQAIRGAESLGFDDWGTATIYVSMRPCYSCSRALTDFYGFRRVVYCIEDLLLPAYAHYPLTGTPSQPGFSRCPDRDTRRAVCRLFAKAFAKPRSVVPGLERFVVAEVKALPRFRGATGNGSNGAAQILIFDADAWHSYAALHGNDDRIFRQLEFLVSSLNPARPRMVHVLGSAGAIEDAGGRLANEDMLRGFGLVTPGQANAKPEKRRGVNGIGSRWMAQRSIPCRAIHHPAPVVGPGVPFITSGEQHVRL